jgi:hypothetical protein
MTSNLTFIIPIGLSHQHLAQRAIASVKAQTIPCELLSQVDEHSEGPGVIRNRLLAKVTTPFVSFLDADDWLEPSFAEKTLAEYQRIGGNRYVFTDWFTVDGVIIETPCLSGTNGEAVSAPTRKPYCGGTWHPITTLIPTDWVRAIGGFDEQLPAVEDTDAYLKLCTSFRCGHRLPVALFHYSPGGGRAAMFRSSPDYDRTMRELTARYGGQMGCCGDHQNPPVPVGEKQPGDVLAMALWHGNREEYGRVTQRFYPRIAMPQTAWVDPRDVAQSPALWRLVEMAPVDHMQGFTALSELAGAGMTAVKRQPAAPVMTPIKAPSPETSTAPQIARVVRLAQRTVSDAPIFVLPTKDYPSYSAVKRLIKLSGYQAIPITKIDVFGRQPYIILTPDQLPNLDGVRARIIAWQLEYAGDYTHNYDGFKGEVWASDKAWADAHGAKYVLMGSHPDLVQGKRAKRTKYDVTMLAYMTPRRQTIKDKLADLRWPEDYPGHDTARRDEVLLQSKLMLHVHQHENAPYCAPQRIALAASAKMPVVCEMIGCGSELPIALAEYKDIPKVVQNALKSSEGLRNLYDELCIEHPFRRCVEDALR